MRKKITPEVPEGSGWSKLDLTQLSSTKLKSIALGSDSAWAVDTDGQAWMRLGSLRPEQISADSIPVWIPIENGPKLQQIVVSASVHIVWALGEDKKVYVRQGVFPDFRLGLDWVPVTGIEDVGSLSASETSVWALTCRGEVYKRSGIGQSNFIGDCWTRIPTGEVAMTGLSVSTCDQPFVMDMSGQVRELEKHLISISVPKLMRRFSRRIPEVTDEQVEGGWAIVE